MVKKAMEEAFAVVLNEFRDATLQDSVVLERVGRQVHGVTGGQMREFAQRLRDAAPPPLTEEQILAWADTFHSRIQQWPNRSSGEIRESPGETWAKVDNVLAQGNRGLPGRSSLAQLLSEHRGVRNIGDLPTLTMEQILAWANAHHQHTEQWPTRASGSITGACGETWDSINQALVKGLRGLPGGSSLAQLLLTNRGVKYHLALPELSEEQILKWADKHYQRTRHWPNRHSGAVLDAPDERWSALDAGLSTGLRGLPGGSSLARLLAKHREVRNLAGLSNLTHEQILAWADAHQQRTGEWPKHDSGPVCDAAGEKWININTALAQGRRGLPGGSSLAQLLCERRGLPNPADRPILTEDQILAWADAHHERTEEWPNQNSGPIAGAAQETVLAVIFLV